MKNQQKLKNRRSILLVILLFFTTFVISKTFKKVNFKDIRIVGSYSFTKKVIFNNSFLNLPTRLIFVNTKYAERKLKKNLSLLKVSVTRQIFPFGLKIIIKTRTPVAYAEKILNGKKIAGFIDEYGIFIDEKYSDKESLKNLSMKVFGWKEKFSNTLSKILNSQKNNDIEFNTIKFSPNGFLFLEEKSLKTILLGHNMQIIDTQLQIISDIKNQLKGNFLLKKIDNIDLTDPNNPKIKVFKP